MVRRFYTKRWVLLVFVALGLYFFARSVNLNGKKLTSSWFFEYTSPSTESLPAVKNDDSNLQSTYADASPIDIDHSVSNSQTHITHKSGIVAFEDLLELKKCPVCFGTELCHQVQSGVIELDLTEMSVSSVNPRKVLYEGKWQKTHSVLAKSLLPSEFEILDWHICESMNEKSNCDVVASASKMVKSGSVSVDGVRRLQRAMKRTDRDITIATCASQKLIELMKKSFDDDRDGHVSEHELIMLYSSLASNAELVILKFLTKAVPSLPFPQYYGACGHIFVVEGAVTSLSKFISEPFHVRASLAAQLLGMVEDFMTDDDNDWYIMFLEFTFDNVGVNKGGEVVILDVEDMIFVDKAYLKSQVESIESQNRSLSHEPCNEDCFKRFMQQIMQSSDSQKSCSLIPHYGHLMYAAVCQRILSYLDEHHVTNLFNSHPRKNFHHLPPEGLLHNPPNKDKIFVEELLQECVQETAAGGRVQAAEELRDYLAEFIQDDGGDDEGEEQNEANEYDIGDNASKNIV